jgi:hypothetical protein
LDADELANFYLVRGATGTVLGRSIRRKTGLIDMISGVRVPVNCCRASPLKVTQL